MGFMKILFFQCLILAAVHLLMAEDGGLFGPPAYDSDDAPEGHNETGEGEHENRLFGMLTTCNSTTQAGRSCLGCRQALKCFKNNVGILRTCHGHFRFCNNGSCSFSPSANCTNSTG